MALERRTVILTSTAAAAPRPPVTARERAFLGFDALAPSWGTNRVARCLVANPCDRRSTEPRSAGRPLAAPAPEDKAKRAGPPELSEIAAVRERLTLDLQKATEEITVSFLADERFAAAKERSGGGGGAAARSSRGEGRKVNSPAQSDPRDRSDAVLRPRRVAQNGVAPEMEVRYFSPQLTWQEIKEDFMAITGRAPSSRPKKRPKREREKLDFLFPGLGLSYKISAEDYKLPEEPKPKPKANTKSKRA